MSHQTMTTKPQLAPARSFHHGNLRQALIDAALSAPDIERLSLRQLASGLGVTAAAAYRHFANREDLLFEVARIGFALLEQRFAGAFDPSVPPSDAAEARQRLIRLGQAYLQFADDMPALWRLMFGSQAEAYRDSENLRGVPKSYEFLLVALMGLRQKGVITAEPNEQNALFAWSAIHGSAALRSGRVPDALMPVPDLALVIGDRIILALR